MIVNNPAAERNAGAIFSVVEPRLKELAETCTELPLQVLEVASGPGQHIEMFGRGFPNVVWQPSEPDAALRQSIDERVALAELNNVQPALALDVCTQWPQQPKDLVMAVNLLHISPWRTTVALMTGARQVLRPSGLLMLYGPYSDAGQHNSAGNQQFDLDLRSRNPQWGIRDVEAVIEAAAAAGLSLVQAIEMPANNRTLFFGRSDSKSNG